jgi:hypothetical protein
VTASPAARDIPGLQGLDFSRLSRATKERSFLQDIIDRADARLVPYVPITPQERLRTFKELGYSPHGLYVPEDTDARIDLIRRVRAMGDVPEPDQRLSQYLQLQQETEGWQQRGVEGHWTGQQALARSTARFRIVAWGRRGGKTTHAAMEAVAAAYARPRSWIWLAAPTMKLVSRAFDKVVETIRDLGLETRTLRDTVQEKLVILDNGARLEGISLENIFSAAGAAIDLAVIDEAAQVVPEAWTRAILPPLTDRNGQALLISSWEGEGDFFHAKALEARSEMVRYGRQASWELFQDASYDVNFFAFPQGRQTPALVQAQKEMDPIEFLEQFGGIPASARERVFPEFKERVHVGDCPYNPELPVVLAVDPSGGSNAYAVLAIQEYADHHEIIDEFYSAHISTEEIVPQLVARPWCDAERVSSEDALMPRFEVHNITDVIIDSAVPEEMRRWERMGFPAYSVPEKPQIWERLPLGRNLLRDPVRFYYFYRKRVNLVLREMGKEPDSDYDLPPEEQRALVVQVEEGLADDKLFGETLNWLKSCAHVMVDRHCTNTINEFKSYTYPKRRRLNMNYNEKPRDWMNHSMDAWGYYVWTRRRFDHETEPVSFNYLERLAEATEEEVDRRTIGLDQVVPPPYTPRSRMQSFLDHVRPPSLNPYEPQSYLEAAAR